MRLLIRADASGSIGTGHVLRCMALGQALVAMGDSVVMVCCEIPNGLAERVRGEEIDVIEIEGEPGSKQDLDKTLTIAKGWADAVLLDGYKFDLHFQRAWRRRRYRLAVIDDYAHSDGYSAHILINQNLHAKEMMYPDARVDEMLLGPKYALLRREFWDQKERKVSVKTRRVLVTLGGADPDNVTAKVIAGLKAVTLDGVEARVLVGASNPHLASLRKMAGAKGTTVDVLEAVTDMRAQYDWADIAIAGGGSTTWELAFMGVPSIVIILAENQDLIAKSVWRAGIGRLLGWHEKVSEMDIAHAVRDLLSSSETRDQMSRWGQEIVDGQGAVRVADALREIAK